MGWWFNFFFFLVDQIFGGIFQTKTKGFEDLLTSVTKARENGSTHSLAKIPSRLGYRRLVISFGELVVGSKSSHLQKLLTDSIPENLSAKLGSPKDFKNSLIEDVGKVEPNKGGAKGGGRSNVETPVPGRASRLTDLTMTNADLKEAVIAYGLFLFTEEDSVDKYGFRRMRSTELAVTHLTDVIRREGENGNLTGCVFIDLSKAFDTISHSGLLSKLSTYGVRGTELAWFTDYLFCRSQVVQYKGVLSEPQPILTGVPQGSILGPILFIIFFNDVHKPLQHSKIITYADDSVIYTSSKDIDTIQRSLSEDMNNLCEWFKDNELIINLKKDKTESMLFGTAKRINLQDKELKLSVNGTLINNTSTYKYLGVHLDSSLNLASHFDRIYKKAATRINLLRSIRPLIDQKCAESIYNTMIAPIFTYCGTLGLSFPDYRKEMIKNIERRGFKVIGNSSFNPPSVNNLIKRKSCLFVFDCLLNNVCTPFKNYFERLVHSKATRNNGISVKLPKIYLDEEKNIKSTDCQCPRGNFKCGHAAALFIHGLYTLNRTDVECQWRQRKATNFLLPSVQEMFPPAKPGYRALLRDPTCEERSDLFQKLKNYGKFTGLYWLMSPEPENQSGSLSVATVDDMIFQEECLQLQGAGVQRQYFLEKVKVDWKTIEDVSRLTSGQRDNPSWQMIRKGRLTASNFGLALNAKRVTPSLIKRLLGEYDLSRVKAVQWGVTNESEAIKAFTMRTGLAVVETGVWLHESGVLGASPDGLVGDDSVLEAKCP
ncbi:putative RNA-directed DNA polymerase from transposon BS [Stylophora pistillata]|uniref:Putative RNA-directed DNA polymerase from transposon BS n=1 Tax=Stylophora pistillata TaxID=50429 RepID=A0A2B4SU23_STYPI|nr:putative RNA-directed DNA polymerase from transposon BS [Stylophora pistillata]